MSYFHKNIILKSLNSDIKDNSKNIKPQHIMAYYVLIVSVWLKIANNF